MKTGTTTRSNFNNQRDILREDAQSFASMVARGQDRSILYSDYAVGTPFYADVSWAPIPSIRYAVDDVWMIHRGTSKNDPTPQYIALAQALVSEPYYPGASFSPGDKYVADVASGVDGPGNAMTYVRMATSRHLEVVLSRLASLGVP
jgi:Beta protein